MIFVPESYSCVVKKGHLGEIINRQTIPMCYAYLRAYTSKYIFNKMVMDASYFKIPIKFSYYITVVKL